MTGGWSGRGPRVFRMTGGGGPGDRRAGAVVDNLARMVESLERERDRVVRTGSVCCLVLVAMDRPDGATAEQVAGEIGGRLLTNLRPYDDVYCYGPDRLLISLPHVRMSELPGILARLRDLVADEPVPLRDGREVAVTASLGCATMDGRVSVRAVLDRADQALRRALAAGGDCFHLWSPDD